MEELAHTPSRELTKEQLCSYATSNTHTRTSKRSNKQLSRVRGQQASNSNFAWRTQTNQKPRLRSLG